MPKPTRPELLRFALAGAVYILIANPLLNYIMFLSLKALGVPAVIHGSSYGFACGQMPERFFETHTRTLFWLLYGHKILILTSVVTGFIWHTVIKKHNQVQRSVGYWLSILLIALPLYFSAEIITLVLIRVIRGVHVGSFFTTSGLATAIIMLFYSIVAGLWLYLKVFRKDERKYLWLVSLPAIVATYFLWRFVLGPMVLPGLH